MVTIDRLKEILSALIKYKIDTKADKSEVLFYEIEKILEFTDVSMEVHDDGDGNIVITFTGVEIIDDGNGNILIESEYLDITDEGNGNIVITI